MLVISPLTFYALPDSAHVQNSKAKNNHHCQGNRQSDDLVAPNEDNDGDSACHPEHQRILEEAKRSREAVNFLEFRHHTYFPLRPTSPAL